MIASRLLKRCSASGRWWQWQLTELMASIVPRSLP